MDNRQWLGSRGRLWRAVPLAFLHERLGRLRPVLVILLSLMLLWGLRNHASLELVAAGIAIFLFGLFFLEQGFGQLASSPSRWRLRMLVSSQPRAFGVGFFATLLTQSSALVALLTLSFLSAGMLTLLSSVAIMAGASLGTTSGGWLMASLGLKASIGDYALPLLVVGMLLISMPRWGTRGLGMVISGMGFLFLGIDYIKQGFMALSALVELSRYAVSGWQGLWLYCFGGLVITLIMQSSHASLLICMAALNAGQLDYSHALAMVLGINVGATGPVLLGAVHSSLDGQRLAWLDPLFKGVTMLACLLIFQPLMQLNDVLSDWIGLAEQDLALRLALFHTLFNLIAIAWLLPLAPQALRLMRWLMPRRSGQATQQVHALYLSRVVALHPATAEQALLRELIHLFHACQLISAKGLLGVPCHEVLSHPSIEDLEPSEELPNLQDLYQQEVKPLFGEIVTFAALSKGAMNLEQSAQIERLLQIARSMTEVIRLQRQLQPNLLAALNGTDEPLRHCYQAWQKRLLLMYRTVRLILEQIDDPAMLSRLYEEEKLINVQNHQDREQVEALIREQSWEPLQAATLMNDTQTLRRIQRQWLKAVSALFAEYSQQQNQSPVQLLDWLRQQELATPC